MHTSNPSFAREWVQESRDAEERYCKQISKPPRRKAEVRNGLIEWRYVDHIDTDEGKKGSPRNYVRMSYDRVSNNEGQKEDICNEDE